MVTLTIIFMTLLAWRLGAFDEWATHRQLKGFDQDVWVEADEADWDDRQRVFRSRHPGLGHNRPHMSLGRRK